MDVNLDEKVGVITGGAGGIGLAIAEAFGRAGARVAICDLKQSEVSNTLGYLEKQGLSAYGEPVDVSKRSEIFSFADEVERHFGGIDIWVSNAGAFLPQKIINTTEEQWQMIMDVNVKSVYYGALIAADKIRKRGSGVLINAASFASLMPSLGSGAYAASKAAVYSMTKSLAAELAPFNIRVIGYIPGVIETQMTTSTIKSKGDSVKSPIALRRIGEPKDVANAVLFAASDRASYITGTCIEVSGGKFCVQNPQDAWA
jgi:NAD(P)-dependent dehydrogenase (short-subunit alcohol dehydrogenase family)